MILGARNGYGAPLYRDLILGTEFVEEDSNGRIKSAEVFRLTLMKRFEVVSAACEIMGLNVHYALLR